MPDVNFNVALLSGALAGTTVDASLYPLDTIKTRLQSSRGFWKTGGFSRIYSGVVPVLLGSAPTAAMFFCVYEPTKTFLRRQYGDTYESLHQMFAASFGEMDLMAMNIWQAACCIRVPVEVVKQRAQASSFYSSLSVLKHTLHQEGMRGMYRGFISTAIREIPFSFLEMPLWELLKVHLARWQGRRVDAWQSGLCGSVAGAIAGGLTTPLDVAKTRIMLAKKDSAVASGSILFALTTVYQEGGIVGLFAGILPRIVWIAIGGAIFLGIYDKSVTTLTAFLHPDHRTR